MASTQSTFGLINAHEDRRSRCSGAPRAFTIRRRRHEGVGSWAVPLGTLAMMEIIAATTMRRFAANTNKAASRNETLSFLPTNVSIPAIQFTAELSALSAVKIAAEIATPNDAPSDEAIL